MAAANGHADVAATLIDAGAVSIVSPWVCVTANASLATQCRWYSAGG